MLKVSNLVKIYPSGEGKLRALDGVSFEITDGELVAVTGRSGSGKSTLLNIMGLLDKPTEGEYYINDKKASGLPLREQAKLRNAEIGFVVQDFALVEKYTVKQNVNIPLIYSKKQLDKERAIREVLRRVGLSDKINTPVYKLSGGQKQRTAIARAVVNDPSVILADEPTGALDSVNANGIMTLFESLSRAGKTVVIVTHDMNIAARCSRRIELSDGKII